jgi:hypothetical protein
MGHGVKIQQSGLWQTAWGRQISFKLKAGTSAIWLGIAGAVFVAVLTIVRGPELPGGYSVAIVMEVGSVLFAFTGCLFRRWAPVVVKEVVIDDGGIQFGEVGKGGWWSSWVSQSFRLDVYLYPSITPTPSEPYFAIRIRDGIHSSYVTREVYEAILVSARKHELSVTEVVPTRPGELRTTISSASI